MLQSNNYDWEKYLQFAEALFDNKLFADEETTWRNCISRAYYSIFHHVRDIRGYTKVKSSAHSKLIKAVRRDHGLEKRKEIADLVEELRGQRNAADYENGSLEAKDAINALNTARQIKELIKKLSHTVSSKS